MKETRYKLLVQDRRLLLSFELGIEVGYIAPVSNIRQKVVPVSEDRAAKSPTGEGRTRTSRSGMVWYF